MKTPKSQTGLLGAIAIGLASMLGGGVFVVFAESFKIAGSWLFVALLLAGVVAVLNSASVYQLARFVDRPGGAYSYARVYRNDTLSFVAGFSFVFGKIGSIAAIALALGAYLYPQNSALVAMLSVLVMVVINSLGIQRTALVAALLATSTSLFLLCTLFVAAANFNSFNNSNLVPVEVNDSNIAMAASVLFFAFAGYARIATLGNEVRDSKRNIPRAIVITLSFVILLYFSLGFVLVAALGGDLATSGSAFLDFYELLGINAGAIVKIVVTLASLGSILALLAGVSRTAATMAEDGELPKRFEQRNRFGSPWLAEVIIAVGASLLVLSDNLAVVIGFSSFSVLLYYSIAHLSALGQPVEQRLMPRFTAIAGLALSGWLAISVPGNAAWQGALILGLALIVRAIVRRRKSRVN